MKRYSNVVQSTFLSILTILTAVFFTRYVNHHAAINAASITPTAKQAPAPQQARIIQSNTPSKEEYVIEIRNTFKETVLNSSIPVVVEFRAPWCPACNAAKQPIEELAVEQPFKAKVRFTYVDIDQNPEITAHYGIKAIPTFAFFKDGQKIGDSIGFNGKESLIAIINERFSF